MNADYNYIYIYIYKLFKEKNETFHFVKYFGIAFINYIFIYIYIYIYIHRHMFHPSQDSSVWLGLTTREQLMSPECSKNQVLNFAKMLVVW